MAIQFSFTAPIGVGFPSAYGRVTSGSWTIASGTITATLDIYADQTQRDAGSAPVSSQSISFPIDLTATQNIVAQAYDAIKARPEFAGAVDV